MENTVREITNLKRALTIVKNKGITNMNQLMQPGNSDIREVLWLAIQAYVWRWALYTNTSAKADGTTGKGNKSKMNTLRGKYHEETDDIRHDVLIYVFKKLSRTFDKVLNKPIDEQVGYILSAVNSCLCDKLKYYNPKHYARTESLNRKVNQDGSELGELLPDENSIEEDYEDKQFILNEIAALSANPAMLLAHLARHHLGLQPRKIEELVNEEGGITAFAKIIRMVADKYRIPVNDIRACLVKGIGKEKTLSELNAGKISNLWNRAKKTLKRDIIDGDKVKKL